MCIIYGEHEQSHKRTLRNRGDACGGGGMIWRGGRVVKGDRL